MEFSGKIINWYNLNKRDLPWRNIADPFKIWLSEIILQQTRVDQGINYYLNFTNHYSSVHDLADAPEQEILKLWQGLGYYTRARNMLKTAIFISKNLNGNFPEDFEELQKLPGIGDYTAAAIASLAFNKPNAVVDGNVSRVLARVFGIDTSPASPFGKKIFKDLANELLDKNQPGTHNQAVMEFGAIYCKPVNPDCQNCIFREHCYALANGKVAQLPLKQKKAEVKNRFFNYLIINNPLKSKGIVTTFIQKRIGNDIWKNLFQFPLIETTELIEISDLVNTTEWKSIFGESKPEIKSVSGQIIHILSHQRLITRFITLEINESEKLINTEYLQIPFSQIADYPMPRLIDRYLEGKL